MCHIWLDALAQLIFYFWPGLVHGGVQSVHKKWPRQGKTHGMGMNIGIMWPPFSWINNWIVMDVQYPECTWTSRITSSARWINWRLAGPYCSSPRTLPQKTGFKSLARFAKFVHLKFIHPKARKESSPNHHDRIQRRLHCHVSSFTCWCGSMTGALAAPTPLLTSCHLSQLTQIHQTPI